MIFEKKFNGDQRTAYSHYKTLKTRIRILPSNMPEYKMISTYLTNTHGPTHSFKLTIEEIYTTRRLGEYQRYKINKNLGNRRLLWHGTKIRNLSSILSNGLLTTPPSSAGISGKNFGNGIYFADVVTKAALYCGVNRNDPYGILILAEVALGKHYYLTSATSVTDLKYQKSSAKALGKYKPDRTKTVRTKYGAQVPLGTLELQNNLTTSMEYSEYVIYNNDQVLFEYLVLVKFNY
ncbi:poly [ADP-ribose] polymerase 1-like [Condylostylus longicornis]|uniref:poly [ADP-ribose] polymerase 1-like n=1 Tax=Condylostylus longicornis TaxID=2530218 RepID=UPI00244DF7BB|nr:poly [ADP-ribose] polymerase 1-like [Condylostylus longicornis]